MAKPKLISLFSGIGGIDLAFEQAGFEIVCQVENNPFCNQVLEKHWPQVQRLGDIRHVRGNDLPAANVMAGGFPCQDISNAGNRAGIKEGNRSGLWFEFARLIGEFRPAVVFLENVPAITANGGTTVLESLAALRYDAEWGVMAAMEQGAPHKRERWFCAAYANSARLEEWAGVRADAETEQQTIERSNSELADTKSSVHTAHNNQARGEQIQSGGDYRRTALYRRGATQSILGRMSDGLSAGLDGHRWPARPGESQHDWEPPRTAVKGEIKHRADRLRALGNAVVPQVIYPFAVAIRDYLENKR